MGNIVLPTDSTLLIDTNLFIDLFEHEAIYENFLKSANTQAVTFVSCDLVRGEFVRTKDQEKFIEKNELFSKLITTILPMDVKISELLIPTMEEYGRNIEGVSIVDIVLACFIKRYKGLYLLTRNHKDFPLRIFERSCIFCIEHERDVKTYALYQYRV